MVPTAGIEPVTYMLRAYCSTYWAKPASKYIIVFYYFKTSKNHWRRASGFKKQFNTIRREFYLWIVNRTLLLLGSGPLYSYYYNLSIWTKCEHIQKKIWLPISDLSKSYSNRNTTPKVILAYFFYYNNIFVTLCFPYLLFFQ